MTSIKGPSRVVKYTRSTRQVKRMKSFLSCANFWSTKTDTYTRQLWTDSSKGKRTGYTTFMKLNTIRVYNGLSILATPPPEL